MVANLPTPSTTDSVVTEKTWGRILAPVQHEPSVAFVGTHVLPVSVTQWNAGPRPVCGRQFKLGRVIFDFTESRASTTVFSVSAKVSSLRTSVDRHNTQPFITTRACVSGRMKLPRQRLSEMKLRISVMLLEGSMVLNAYVPDVEALLSSLEDGGREEAYVRYQLVDCRCANPHRVDPPSISFKVNVLKRELSDFYIQI